MAESNEFLADFVRAACVPLDSGHSTGTLDQAQRILDVHPEVAGGDIYAAAILGDHAAVRRFLAENPANARAKRGPYQWDALTYLCFSKYLRLDPGRSAAFVDTAKVLLDAGASANTGFYSQSHQPTPEFESVLYGAAGIAHHPELTRLLLERGADPNDGEVTYHTPESYDNAALKVLVESGKLTPDSLATMLLRKADWHDLEGIKFLLEHGADPNRVTGWGKTALHNAALSDNGIEIFETLLDHGADPTMKGTRPDVFRSAAAKSAVALAAQRGRADVLDLFQRRGIPFDLERLDQLIAACARNNVTVARSMASEEPELLDQLRTLGGRLLAAFAANGNTDGVRLLLDLGIDVKALDVQGDGYFDIAPNSTALHAAAWRIRPATVRLLVDRGATVDLPDGQGRTPLQRAVCACVDSYWTERRSPECVQALLNAGASVRGVSFPSGYPPVDELLRAHGATPGAL